MKFITGKDDIICGSFFLLCVAVDPAGSCSGPSTGMRGGRICQPTYLPFHAVYTALSSSFHVFSFSIEYFLSTLPIPFQNFSSSQRLTVLLFPFYFSNSFPELFFFPVFNSPTIYFLLFPTSFRDFSSSQWLLVLTFPFYFSNSFPGLFFFPAVHSPTISFLLFPTPFSNSFLLPSS